MAVIVATRVQVSPPNTTQFIHHPYRVGAAVLQGHVLILDANGRVIPSGGTAPAAGVAIYGIAMMPGSVGGQPVEAFQVGFLSGYAVSALAYGALIYAGANGELDTATGPVVIGEVMSFGYSAEKMAYIDVTRTWLL